MRIGILGCGYVGQALALYWKEQGHRIAVTTRQISRVSFLQSFTDEVFLLKNNNLSAFLEQQEALLVSVAPDKNSDYASTYLDTAKQIREISILNPSLQSILYTSSTSVYGDHEGNWVDENSPIFPNDENQNILYQTEQILLNCSSEKRKVCIFRLGEIYGPNRKIEDRLRRMQNQPFAGTGTSYTNLIHLTDILHALDFALQRQLEGIYNLCNDYHLPRKDFYDELCRIEQLTPVQWNPALTSRHQGNKRVSNKKIKDEGFQFSFPSYFCNSSDTSLYHGN